MNYIGTLDHLPNELVSEVLDFTYKGSFNHFNYIYSTIPSFQKFLRFDSPLIVLTNSVSSLQKDKRFSNINSTLMVDLSEKNIHCSFIEQNNHSSFIFIIYNNIETLEKSSNQISCCKRRDEDIITPKPQWEKSMSFIVRELHYMRIHYEAVLIGEEFKYDEDLISKQLCDKRSRRRLCDGVRYIQGKHDITVLCDPWGKSKQLVIS